MRIRFSRNWAAARTAAAPGLFSSCIRPAARVPSEAIFSCWTTTLWNFWKRYGHVAEDGFAHVGADGHHVPELLLVELEQLAGLDGAHVGAVGGVGEQRQLAEGGAGGHGGHILLAAVGEGLVDAHFAAEKDPEEVGGFALAGDVARPSQDAIRGRRRGS